MTAPHVCEVVILLRDSFPESGAALEYAGCCRTCGRVVDLSAVGHGSQVTLAVSWHKPLAPAAAAPENAGAGTKERTP